MGYSFQFEAVENEGKFFINPGSATGAYNALERYIYTYIHLLVCSPIHLLLCLSYSEVIPSFVLMDIQGASMVMYVYQLHKDVKVQKIEYKKKTSS